MKISLNLPDWCQERNIYILTNNKGETLVMAGIELVAYKNFNEKKFHIKTARCTQCGKCCRNLPKGQYPLDKKGDCIHLGKDGEKYPCKLGGMRYFPCCEGDPVKGKWDTGFCSIKYDW